MDDKYSQIKNHKYLGGIMKKNKYQASTLSQSNSWKKPIKGS